MGWDKEKRLEFIEIYEEIAENFQIIGDESSTKEEKILAIDHIKFDIGFLRDCFYE